MIATIKSEFLKLFTVRSTYILTLLALVFIALLNLYFEGYRGNSGSPAANLESTAVREIVANASGMVAVFIAIISILLMAHEYRYNTIMFTLTANTHRTRVLLSKSLAIVTFGVVFGVLAMAFAVGCYFIGLELRDAVLPAQQFDVLFTLGKVTLYFTVYSLIGLLLAGLVKGVVGAIAFFFVAPITVEPLLRLVLKDNAAYLPFTMFDSIMGAGLIQSKLSTTRIVLFSALYIAIAWLITWILFLRRDAN